MKIGIPVGGFHQGNTGEYVLRALKKLGHEAAILNQSELFRSAESQAHDLYFCVDSGETLSLSMLPRRGETLKKLAFWFIDYRHNKDRPTRVPTDRENTMLISAGGGWIFQAQQEDVADCKSSGMSRVSWLPMAADAEIWSDQPKPAEKLFDIVFVGNIWDEGRLQAIVKVKENFSRFGFFGNGAIWKEKAASAIRAGKLGFNISSWYGDPVAFDINMRFFETLSCGVPLVTNHVPSLKLLMPSLPEFVKVYNSAEEIVPVLRSALASDGFLSSGPRARSWIMEHGTYLQRMNTALDVLKAELG